MNRRNFFKLAAASIAGFFIPRKTFHTGGIVEFSGPRHGGKSPLLKFDNHPSCYAHEPCILVFRNENVFTDEQRDLIHKIVVKNSQQLKRLT